MPGEGGDWEAALGATCCILDPFHTGSQDSIPSALWKEQFGPSLVDENLANGIHTMCLNSQANK